LENYWNGTLLTTVDEALRWAANVTWNGVSPFMHLVRGTYFMQISVPKQVLKAFAQQWQRSETLPKWDISMSPT
jgi:hypothetical protein